MPTPKKFIQQAIEMETFFEDEEPTYDEFMRYPPFDSLMEDKFSLQNMINAYREGRIVFMVTARAITGKWNQKQCNFITKEKPNIVFTIYNSSPTTYDEIDPTSLDENTHEALMNVKLEPIRKGGEVMIKCENLTLEQESAFSSFVAKVLYEKTFKEQGADGKQALTVKFFYDDHRLLTTPYLKIYEPFNTNLPEFISKRLTELFESAKV